MSLYWASFSPTRRDVFLLAAAGFLAMMRNVVDAILDPKKEEIVEIPLRTIASEHPVKPAIQFGNWSAQ